jgi:hypothetical protein
VLRPVGLGRVGLVLRLEGLAQRDQALHLGHGATDGSPLAAAAAESVEVASHPFIRRAAPRRRRGARRQAAVLAARLATGEVVRRRRVRPAGAVRADRRAWPAPRAPSAVPSASAA